MSFIDVIVTIFCLGALLVFLMSNYHKKTKRIEVLKPEDKPINWDRIISQYVVIDYSEVKEITNFFYRTTEKGTTRKIEYGKEKLQKFFNSEGICSLNQDIYLKEKMI
jgi:hypothetical protein